MFQSCNGMRSSLLSIYAITAVILISFSCCVFRAVCCAVAAVLVALVASSPTKGWSGRSLSLLDPYVAIPAYLSPWYFC